MQTNFKHFFQAYFNMSKAYGILFFIFFLAQVVVAQKDKTDSLETVIKKIESESNHSYSVADTSVISSLCALSRNYLKIGDAKMAMMYAVKSNTFSEKLMQQFNEVPSIAVKKWYAHALNSRGLVNRRMNNYSEALHDYEKSLKIRIEINDEKGQAGSFNNIGTVFFERRNSGKAIEYFFKALRINEKIKNEEWICSNLNNIGAIYEGQNEFDKALAAFNRALAIQERLGNKSLIGNLIFNKGICYRGMTKNYLSLQQFQKAIEIREETGERPRVADSYCQLGKAYYIIDNYDKAIEAESKALAIAESLQINDVMINCYRYKNEIYDNQIHKGLLKPTPALLKEMEILANKCLTLSKKIDNTEGIKDAYAFLSEVYGFKGEYKKALEYHRLFFTYTDSMVVSESRQKYVEAELNYQFEKKEGVLKSEQEKKDAIMLEEAQKQKIIRNSLIAGFLLMVLLAVFVIRSFRIKQKAHRIITVQKLEVEKQKTIIEQKQNQIVDSINYAKRIQNSILVSEEEIKKHISNLFILYLPRDIVSGDFYWFSPVMEKTGPSQNEFILLEADCTGHGVPGAFLSMVGSTLLNEIVRHNNVYDPAAVIKELAKELKATLSQTDREESNTDGMDISICKINLEKGTVRFAGANQSLYLVNSEGIRKINPQVNSINGILDIDYKEKIDALEICPEKGTMVYLTSDGYADQIGESSKKKFLTSRFEKLLAEIHFLPTEDQKIKLNKTLSEWKGKMNQVDDVLIIGFRI